MKFISICVVATHVMTLTLATDDCEWHGGSCTDFDGHCNQGLGEKIDCYINPGDTVNIGVSGYAPYGDHLMWGVHGCREADCGYSNGLTGNQTWNTYDSMWHHYFENINNTYPYILIPYGFTQCINKVKPCTVQWGDGFSHIISGPK